MRLTRKQDATIARMIRRGLSYRAAGKVFGVSDKTAKAASVRYQNRKSRVPFREKIPSLDASFLEAFAEGLSEKRRLIFEVKVLRRREMPFEDLVARCGVTRQRVWQIEHALIAKLKKKLA
jgi:DNA-directed RNA polymerase specialized sigma subunit